MRLPASCFSPSILLRGALASALAAAPSLSPQLLWSVPTSGIVSAPPLVIGEVVFVGGLDHRFYAIQRESGRVLWTFESSGALGQMPAAYSDSLVFFTASDSALYALKSRDGALAWKYSTGCAFSEAYAPLALDGRVYVGTDDQTVRAIDARSGHEVWRTHLPGRPLARAANHDGLLFYSTFEFPNDKDTPEGYVCAVAIRDGALRWRALLPSSSTTRGGGASGVANDDSLVFAGSHAGFLYALRQRDGSLAWSANLGGTVLTRCAVANGVVYTGTLRNRFVALSESTGHLRWSFSTRGSVDRGAPSVRGSRIAFSASDSRIYLLDRGGTSLLTIDGGFNPVLNEDVLFFGAFDDVARTHSIRAVRLAAQPSPRSP